MRTGTDKLSSAPPPFQNIWIRHCLPPCLPTYLSACLPACLLTDWRTDVDFSGFNSWAWGKRGRACKSVTDTERRRLHSEWCHAVHRRKRPNSTYEYSDVRFSSTLTFHDNVIVWSGLWVCIGNCIIDVCVSACSQPFRLAVLTYRCLHGSAPEYLTSLLQCVSDLHTRQRLRSASSSDLMVPRTMRSTIGEWSFQSAAASTWNALPRSSFFPFFHISVTVQKSTQDRTIRAFILAILLNLYLRHCDSKFLFRDLEVFDFMSR